MLRAKKIARVDAECVACGNCVAYCRLAAIAVPHGLGAVVDADKCVGCGRCAEACPAGVIACTAREDISA